MIKELINRMNEKVFNEIINLKTEEKKEEEKTRKNSE